MRIQLKRFGLLRWNGVSVWTLVGMLISIGIVTFWQLPAAWIAGLVGTYSDCRVVMVHAQGSVWSGKSTLGFSRPKTKTGKCESPHLVAGQIQWQMKCNLLNVNCSAHLRHAALTDPLELTIGAAGTLVKANGAILPHNSLLALGSPWNTLQLQAVVNMKWTDISIAHGDQSGQLGSMEFMIKHLSSAISPVKPLGSYQVAMEFSDQHRFGPKWNLSTLQGPLFLSGQGVFDQRGMHFTGQASSSEQANESLTGLLSLIGRRNGKYYDIQF